MKPGTYLGHNARHKSNKDAPRIECAPGSLIHHSIQGVDYDDRKQSLRDDAHKAEAAVNNDW
jgi:hypothetical protein